MFWQGSLFQPYPQLQIILAGLEGLLACIGITYILMLKQQLAAKTRELAKLSITDPLTGLYNRHKIKAVTADEIQRFKRYKRPFSIILFNMDHFKKINDIYGHSAGDEVLINLASLLTVNIRGTDSIGRWNGEEFLIVCPETTEQEAVNVAENLRKAIASYNLTKDRQCTASFSVTQVIADDDSNALFDRAVNALYQAKSSGRNKVVVTPRDTASLVL